VTAGPHRPGPPPVSTERRRIATTVTESADLAVPVHPDLPDEQRELDQMYTRLDRLRADAQRRRSAALLQSGGDDPQARSERDSYVQLYTEDLARYDGAEHGLYFGRLDLDDGEIRRIGRIGILGEEDLEPLLLDWRAPSARQFYLATTAAPDSVVRRRHVRTLSRRVTGLSDEYLDPAAARDARFDDSGVAGESALLTALEAARTGEMTDIVETIQHEQDAIIRSEHRSVLVVQGGPGTGKTAVALHRAAYLLYTHRKQLSRAGVLIIGPNSTFLDYIGRVLPSLGETGVLLSTIGDLYPGVTATLTDSAAARRVKGDLDIAAVLKTAVRDRQTVPDAPVEIRFDGYRLALDKKVATRARGRARSSRRAHNLARPIFAAVVVEALADQLVEQIGASVLDGSNMLSPQDMADIRDELRDDPVVVETLHRLWPTLTPQQVLSDLLCDPARLASATKKLDPADREALARAQNDHGRFSPADAPLLDELAELLGHDDSAEKERAQQERRRRIAEAQDALDILTGSAPQDLEDDLDPEILMAYDVIDADRLAGRHESSAQLSAAERAATDRLWAFGHVIVDEAQELSAMDWRMLMRRSPNRWMTVVGDVAQTGSPAGADAWAQMLSPYVAERWLGRELTVNYRTPAEIMAVAHDVLAAIDPDQALPRSVRHTGTAPYAVATSEAGLTEAVRRTVADLHDDGTTAVIVPAAAAALTLPDADPAVSVSTVDQVKGLEFDAVVLVEPAAIIDESARGLNDVYVALTRATQRLAVVHARPLPAALSALGGGPTAD